jgi:hypothetical protein
MEANDIIIEFNNDKTMVIEKCEAFSVYPEKGYAEVIKNGYRAFFNFSQIRYIGRKYDIEGSDTE